MKQFHGLDALCRNNRITTVKQLATALQEDLQHGHCLIMGSIGDQSVLLARLEAVPDSVVYHPFEQRLDWVLAGPIVRNDCVPLTYRLQGQQLAITGRCSVIPRVCGVDLYLSSTYSCQLGDTVQQRFSLPLKPLLSRCQSLLLVDSDASALYLQSSL